MYGLSNGAIFNDLERPRFQDHVISLMLNISEMVRVT